MDGGDAIADATRTGSNERKDMSQRTSANDTLPDALAVLISDHQQVQDLFERYTELADSNADDQERESLAGQICTLLTVHAAIEEEIFYPAARDALREETAVFEEALVEHQSAKDLISRVQGARPSDPSFDAYVNVLGEYVNHHVQEEEQKLFPLVRASVIDLNALGQEMSARQEELLTAEPGTMTDKRVNEHADESNMQKDPDDWVTGNEPMTGAQKSYLKTLSEEAHEPFDDTLTKAQASKRIEELQATTGRGEQSTASPLER
jgi:hemerythrin superfamily protein